MGIKERHERDREAVRRAILDAARALFITEGYPNVSIRKIAERVEYSPAAIYSYFDSKDDIFFALAEEGFRLLGAPVDTLEALTPLERLRAIFWRLHEFSCEHPEYFALMFVERSVPRISREYERFDFVRQMRARIARHVQDCIDMGALPAAVQPWSVLRLFMMATVGMATMRLSDRLPDAEDADALAHDMIDTLIAGLRSGVTLRTASLPCPAEAEADAEAGSAAPLAEPAHTHTEVQ